MTRLKERVLLVEDHDIYINCLATVLAPYFDLEKAMTVAEADGFLKSSFDAIVLDLKMPDHPKADIVSHIKQRCGSAAIIVLTGSTDPNDIRAAIMQNASNVILKSSNPSPETLASEIRLGIKANQACQAVDRMRKCAER